MIFLPYNISNYKTRDSIAKLTLARFMNTTEWQLRRGALS